MTLLQSALIVPGLSLGAIFAGSHQIGTQKSVLPAAAVVKTSQAQTDFVLQRKERIQNILVALDRLAEITAQMKPETADRIEPVVVDLAEQTIDLANARALQSSETDASLNKIEHTLLELTRALSRYVEPEASL